MPDTFMNTKEVAQYLDIHEKQVYALIKSKKIPCTRVTGKWLFMKELIDHWLINNTAGIDDRTGTGRRRTGGQLLASGSNDPILDVLLSTARQIYPDVAIYSSSTGSSEGLRLLGEDCIDIAWCHLHSPQQGEYDIPQLLDYFTGKKIAVVHLFYRDQGFISSPDLPEPVSSFKDLAAGGIRFINRQEGSGTRLIIDYNCEKEAVDPAKIYGYDSSVQTHLEVGMAIQSGEADVGVASAAVARLLKLNFVPIITESFDMVLYQDTFFEEQVQLFIESLRSDSFRKRVGSLGGYDFAQSGKIIHSS